MVNWKEGWVLQSKKLALSYQLCKKNRILKPGGVEHLILVTYMGRIIFCFIIGRTILLRIKLDREKMSDDKATYEITMILSAGE